MKLKENAFPCTCGHYRINHMVSYLEEANLMCAVKYCNCNVFIPDNLKYMERKYSGPTN